MRQEGNLACEYLDTTILNSSLSEVYWARSLSWPVEIVMIVEFASELYTYFISANCYIYNLKCPFSVMTLLFGGQEGCLAVKRTCFSFHQFANKLLSS